MKKISIFLRRILLIIFLLVEILFLFTAILSWQDRLLMLIIAIITLILYLLINWSLKAFE